MPKRRNPGDDGSNRGKPNVGRKSSPPAIIRPVKTPPRIEPQPATRPTSPPDRQRQSLSAHSLFVTAVALLTVGFADFALIVGMESIRIGFAAAFHQTARQTIQVLAAPFGGLPAVEDARDVLIDGTTKVPERLGELEQEAEKAQSP